MKKLLLIVPAVTAVAAAGLFTIAWAPVEGDFEGLRVVAFGRVLAELSPEHCSVELAEDYIVDPEACIGCRICVGTCPVEAISMTPDNKAWIDPEKCILCGACVASCPVGAIVTVDEGNVTLFGVNGDEETAITGEFEVY